LHDVRHLYETQLDAAERVPWAWIERGITHRTDWTPGKTNKHFLVATTPAGKLAGFIFAMYLPGYGGYVSYVAVDPAYRGRGVAKKLFRQAFQVLRVDATACDEPMPLVIWESHHPGPGAEALWKARIKLFAHVGGYRIDGVTLPSPNWLDESAPDVPLQLFLAPMDEPRENFDSLRVKQAVEGLLRRVYQTEPGQRTYEATLTPHCHPRLRSTQDSLPQSDGGRRL